jgi:hypothetical protein
LFRLSGEPVALRISSPIFVGDGETVIVIGAFNRNGIFEASAYHNLSTGVSGKSERHRAKTNEAVVAVLSGIVLIGFALFAPNFLRVPVPVAFPLLGLAIALVGLIMFVRSWSMDRTINGLLEEALNIASATETGRTEKWTS